MENTQSPRARPGIKALAEATGYSIATVSKALNGSPMVAPATRRSSIAPLQRSAIVPTPAAWR
ncbi:LacI family DNA-binding transcriptional regulator [Sinorhizobium meliloti]|uniref:LacI family DNA-binding transcriptional regulator n=1 Tax=Rhizobium meliloti TaxID=382 RepID=UPI001F4662C5|nr:LacI family DNA-binding transcriptional regulator [Sinorhizobium meliloti]